MKTPKALIIIKDNVEVFPDALSHLNDPWQLEKISSKDFKKRINGFRILNSLWKYDLVELMVYKNQLLFKPFLIALSIYLVGKTARIRDRENHIEHINLAALIQKLWSYATEILYRPFLLNKIQKQIKVLEAITKNKNRNQKQELHKNQIDIGPKDVGRTDVGPKDLGPTDLGPRTNRPRTNRPHTSEKNNQFVYLRANLWFGMISGGSIAHTSGVLNGFLNYFKNPIFISTDKIPKIHPHIKPNIIEPKPFFANSGMDLWELSFNDYFFNKADTIIKSKGEIAFIYQRYCINHFSGIRLSQKYKVPLILEYNGPEVWKRKKWSDNSKYPQISESIEMLNLHYADIIVVVSDVLKEELLSRGIEEHKILVNPNGVDPTEFSPDNPENEKSKNDIKSKYQLDQKQVIGFIGTFGQWHGVVEMAKAIVLFYDQYPQQFPKTKFLLIGDGVLFQEVRSIIQNSNYKDNVILTGMIPQQESPKYLSCCDIFLSPHVRNSDGSKFFGSPTKLFEYMALGKAIIASDIEQLSDILKHKKTAYLVKSGDSHALAKAIQDVLIDDNLRVELGLNARKEALEKYTWEKHVERIVRFMGSKKFISLHSR